jgi:hypothetical protein
MSSGTSETRLGSSPSHLSDIVLIVTLAYWGFRPAPGAQSAFAAAEEGARLR